MKGIDNMVKDAYKLKLTADSCANEYTQAKVKLQKHFDTLDDTDEVVVESDDGKIVAAKRSRVNIQYYPDKLRKKLPKKLFNEVTNRNYRVTDIEGLIELLKAAGIKQNDFKKYIDVDITIKQDELKQLFEVGDVALDDLKGCYEANVSKYIDIRKKGG